MIPYKETKPMNIKPNQKENKRAFFDVENAEYNDVEVIELLCLDKFEVERDGDKLVLTRIKPQYPKTYEECVRALQLTNFELPTEIGYKGILLHRFQQLLICRDAYWKIASKQIGLDKPWKPDWKSFYSMKHCIGTDKVIVGRCNRTTGNKILAFPTEEMRDAFYDNFKELIEQCKELL